MEKPPSKPSTQSAAEKKTQLVRKPTFQNKKPPEIKQTLTSKYRLLKANPLLKLTLDSKDLSSLPPSVVNVTDSSFKSSFNIDRSNISALGKSSLGPSKDFVRKDAPVLKAKEVKDVATANRVLSKVKPPLPCGMQQATQKPSVNGVTRKPNGLVRSQSLKVTGSQPEFKKPTVQIKPLNNSVRSRISAYMQARQIGKSNQQDVKAKAKSTTEQPLGVKSQAKEKEKPSAQESQDSLKVKNTKPIRRSLSAQHFDRKRGKTLNPELCIERLTSSQSMEDLPQDVQFALLAPNVSPITEEPSIYFKTPSAYHRRSVIVKTPNTSRRSILTPRAISPGFGAADLQERLNEWLKKRNKSLGTFNHLKCFGIHGQKQLESKEPVEYDEENKENIEVEEQAKDSSYEDLKIDEAAKEKGEPPKQEQKDICLTKENLENVAREALSDLHKLILEGYPREHCEAWLKLIFHKYRNLDEEPQYWECRAAIEQSRGNITSAVECYRTAIVQGAEIQAVDESLDHLLQKFSLLNINTTETGEKKSHRKDQARIIQDARNVFKSTIIQFAVQERSLKKTRKEGNDQKRFYATPVRRSTRRRSAYTSTPGVQLCASLQDLDASVRDMLDFQSNNALR